MNKVILSGRLTSDPELRQTQSGVASCRFTIACDRRFADKQTGKREADFIQCTAWRNTAEFISRYFNKGKMIMVEGTLRNNNYQDKNHPDVTHYTNEVMVENAEFCGDKSNNNTANSDSAEVPQYSSHNALEAGQSYGNLSDFEEILSDGDVPF